MLKLKIRQWPAIAVLALAVLGCQQEPLRFGNSADCGGCGDIPPGGGTVVIYCPDLVVYSVISYGRTGNVIKFGVVLKNIGNTTANISNTNLVGWQAWLSKDGVTKSVPACGSAFHQALAPNQLSSPSILNCTFPSSVNLNLYSSMIIELQVPGSIAECSTANNRFVRTPVP